jgi:hypothetical protein
MDILVARLVLWKEGWTKSAHSKVELRYDSNDTGGLQWSLVSPTIDAFPKGPKMETAVEGLYVVSVHHGDGSNSPISRTATPSMYGNHMQAFNGTDIGDSQFHTLSDPSNGTKYFQRTNLTLSKPRESGKPTKNISFSLFRIGWNSTAPCYPAASRNISARLWEFRYYVCRVDDSDSKCCPSSNCSIPARSGLI